MPTRRVSREIALQALFSVEVGHRDPSEVLDEYLLSSADSAHRFFVQDLVLGTLAHSQESDKAIAPLLTDWTVERLPTIDRLLLRMATFELKHRPDVPRPVVINEAIELAKRFSTEDSGRFINGVLSSMIKSNGST